jgi:phage recombination protein Bet
MSNLVVSQAQSLAQNLNIASENTAELVATLKATAFKGGANDAQLAALLLVASQYGLNPWTKEIYAFPDRNNGIVPVVGVDGWSRIINSHDAFDGMDFEQDDESCTCIIYRKDRSHPIKVTEWMAECRRDGVGPWKSHPRRMLRHKAMIQCARLAFGYVGIYDQDEAERIAEVPSGSPGQQAVAAAEPADTPERRATINELEHIAQAGPAALAKKWEAIGKDKRAMVGVAELTRIKAIAEAANTIDGEAREVAA